MNLRDILAAAAFVLLCLALLWWALGQKRCELLPLPHWAEPACGRPAP